MMKGLINKGSVYLFAIFFLIGSVLSGCGVTSTSKADNVSASSSETAGDQPTTDKKKRIALVVQFNIGSFSSQYIAGVKEEVEKLGGELTVLSGDNDLAKMASHVDAAVTQQFDGILLDHGRADSLAPGVQKALAQKTPIVAFDTGLDIPGLTVVEQDDIKLAEQTLNKMAQDTGGKGNIVKIWVAGFTPMERRQIAYKAFMDKNSGFNEIAAFGSASANTALDTQAQMEAILKQYPNKGDITAVWTAWDEFAKGATRAIQQAGRNEIKVYGIDMSDEDLQMLQDQNSPWIATAAVDPSDIGRVQARYLFKKLKGEQVPDKVSLNPVLITREQLPKEPVKMADLNKYVKEWGTSTQGQ
ncbi:sugar ABC transporter substrate-binding protein [Brevibacillus laterosporus]|uniref:sugar ABC transporter substrate-binding protein n=1 Tax=Brevibacillus laterosporus TaxID=1465 RepID=UPI00215C4179|nr:sugar ABC transporter substrate-binding protein [Brevibacillus laterosporus]MCR8993460.1 sugar ABC transporter substrate-binding protein [Brevibacillus laterosporus]